MRPLQLSLLVAVVAVPVPLHAANRRDPAGRAVRSVLEREIETGVANRAEALGGRRKLLRMNDEARWQSGQIRYGSGWATFENVPKLLQRQGHIRKYRALRNRAANSRDGQLALANWCRTRRLFQRERAHLTAALRLSDNHDEPQIRRRLGFVNVNNEWVHQGDLKDRQESAAVERRLLAEWRRTIQTLFGRTRVGPRHLREAAVRKLRELKNPDVLPALEAVLANRDEAAARLHVEILNGIPSHKAADALAKVAVASEWKSVRDAAASHLRSRPIEAFAPELLAKLKLPIDSNVQLVRDRRGIHLIHDARQETQSKQREVHERTTVLASSGQLPRGPGRRTKALDRLVNPVTRAQERAEALKQDYARRNKEIAATNKRVCAVLKEATGLQIADTPNAWWGWWQSFNQLTDGSKSYRALYYYETRLASIPDKSRKLIIPSNLRPEPVSPPTDCLVAGTKVWTDRGPVAIEEVRIGDLVLSKHARTGELRYKPILRTTRRTPEPIVRIVTTLGNIRATGGHTMWISGRGWTKCRDARPGDRFHGAKGSVEIVRIEKEAKEPTFNLLVADFHTYFVGDGVVLSHDLTFAEPTDVVVPGLEKVWR